MHKKEMMTLEWDQCEYLLDPDEGAFREIHVPGQSSGQSVAIYEHLRSTYSDLHFTDHPDHALPPAQEYRAIESETDRTLYFAHGGLGLYFFWLDAYQAELSFDVREVRDQGCLDTLSEIIIRIADQVGRDCVITHENSPTSIMCVFKFADHRFEVVKNE